MKRVKEKGEEKEEKKTGKKLISRERVRDKPNFVKTGRWRVIYGKRTASIQGGKTVENEGENRGGYKQRPDKNHAVNKTVALRGRGTRLEKKIKMNE